MVLNRKKQRTAEKKKTVNNGHAKRGVCSQKEKECRLIDS